MGNDFNQFLKDREKELQKRVKRIVNYTLEDFHGNGFSTNESEKSLSDWVQKAMLETSGIDDMNVYEISLRVLEMLNSLDMVDLDLIHSILFKDLKPSEDSTVFCKVVL
jgi:hypothetical protein